MAASKKDTPINRMKLHYPGHPEVTVEDLKAGRLPELTPEELARRRKALDEALKIRKKLDIRPLTTTRLTRELRDGRGS
jgi:hypothetical protein